MECLIVIKLAHVGCELLQIDSIVLLLEQYLNCYIPDNVVIKGQLN